MHFTKLALVLALTAGATAFAEDKEVAKDAKLKLEGGYTVVASEYGGKDASEKVKGDIIRFTGDKILVTDKDKKETYSATYKLDESSKPCKITMTAQSEPLKGQTVEGIIELKGDTGMLIYALPGGKAPTEFKSAEKQIMITFKNMKK